MTRTALATPPPPPTRAAPRLRRSRLPYLGVMFLAVGWAVYFIARSADYESSLPDLAGAVVSVATLAAIFVAWLGRRRSSPGTASRRVGTGILVAVVALTLFSVFDPTGSATVSGGGTGQFPAPTTTTTAPATTPDP